MKSLSIFLTLCAMMMNQALAQDRKWSPAPNPLMTQWAEQVNPNQPLSKYPRPQLVRDDWKSLNGLWEYAIVLMLESAPTEWMGEILVPFGIESSLSGVKKRVGPNHKLWYQTAFTVPKKWNKKRIFLHFGAVDWKSEIWVNGKNVGHHQGGYTGFSMDITDALKKGKKQQITVSVWDPTDDGVQPRGKQVRDPQSIWYTPTTGIWQTVWLEAVPEVSIENLKMEPNIGAGELSLTVSSTGGADYTIKAVVFDGSKKVNEVVGKLNEAFQIPIKNAKLWSPDSPFLYDLKVVLMKDGKKVDAIESYFGMREVNVAKAADGFMRLFLNGEPIFHYGLLDQGFWPDGIYTAPTDEALRYDIEVTKKLGFNMIRKHVKVEPARWYYWADKLGILVWQDMPSGDDFVHGGKPDIIRSAQSAYNYKQEFKEMITQHYNNPSIVVWVPFNEGWGQFQTEEITELARQLDPTRIINTVSGWQDRGVGDMHDIHSYPGPAMPEPESNRTAILGEFGGEALVVKDHLWIKDLSRAPSHYETSQSKDQLHATYKSLLTKLMELKSKGLAGAVYTQTTDVESEVNGIMTYDRKVIKFDLDFIKELHRKVIKE